MLSYRKELPYSEFLNKRAFFGSFGREKFHHLFFLGSPIIYSEYVIVVEIMICELLLVAILKNWLKSYVFMKKYRQSVNTASF